MKKNSVQPIVPSFNVKWHAPNASLVTVLSGDILLVRNPNMGLAEKGILLGEWLHAQTRPYAWTHHSMFALSSTEVVQETGAGSVLTPLSAFDSWLYAVITINCPNDQKALAIEFENWTLGQKYGWSSIIGDGLDDLTGLSLSLSTHGRMVCSASVARACERMGLIPDKDPTAVVPADNARYFNLPTQTAKQYLK
jgi:hypothetical protein